MKRLALTCVVLWSSVVFAADARSSAIIVSVSGGGANEADLSNVASVVATVMEPLAPKWGASLGVEIDRVFGEPPRTMVSKELAGYPRAVQSLDEKVALHEGSFVRNIRELEEIRKSFVENQGTLTDASARRVYASVLEVLARAHLVESNSPAKASDCLAELARTFPGQPLNAQRSPAQVRNFYNSMLEKLKAPAPIEVLTDGPKAPEWRLYVNGRQEPSWRTPALRGDYQIFVSTPSGDSRVHVVTVGDRSAPFRVDVLFDMALNTEKSVGLRWDDLSQQSRYEELYALTIAKKLGLGVLIVVSHGKFGGKLGVRFAAYVAGQSQPLYEFAEGQTARDIGEEKTKAMASALLRRISGARAKAVESPPVVPDKQVAAQSSPKQSPSVVLSPPVTVKPSGVPARPSAPPLVVAADKPQPKAPTEPVKKPAETNTGSIPEQLQRIQDDYVHSRYDVAISTGNSLLKQRDLSPDDYQRAARVVAASSCFKKDVPTVLNLLRKLGFTGRSFIRFVCNRQGITLPSDEKLGVVD